jgi:hypothetical protein
LNYYFAKIRYEAGLDFKLPEFTADSALSVGLTGDKKKVPPHAILEILALMNSIHNFSPEKISSVPWSS